MIKLTAAKRKRLASLAKLPESRIDLSDIPEIKNLSALLQNRARSGGQGSPEVEVHRLPNPTYDDLLNTRFDAILDAWRALAPGAQGRRVSWTTPSGEARGVTVGIDDRGALLVRVGDRVERIVAGEVLWS